MLCLALALATTSQEVQFFPLTAPVAQHWVGPEFWGNRNHDWQVTGEGLESIAPLPNRSLALLTFETTGDFATAMDVEWLNQTRARAESRVGWQFDAKGQFNDYRDSAVFGTGTFAGLNGVGDLVVGGKTAPGPGRMAMRRGVKLGLQLNGNQATVKAVHEGREWSVTNEVTRNPGGMLKLTTHMPGHTGNGGPAARFRNWAVGGGVMRPNQAWGPILFNQYTVSEGELNLTSQLPPLAQAEGTLQVFERGEWRTKGRAKMDADSRTLRFRVPLLDSEESGGYKVRVRYLNSQGQWAEAISPGVIRSTKVQRRPTTLAALSCFLDYGFPAQELVAGLQKQDPDILFFAGDQLYEGNGGLGIQTSPIEPAMLDYLRKWYLWGWTFGELTQDRPTITIPDDHDVFNSNLWGAGGRVAPPGGTKNERQDSGGYTMPARFVNMVERTQTSHFPRPARDWTSPDGIGAYFTSFRFRDLDLAVVEDRKFKSAPKPLLPDAKIFNGFPQNLEFDWSSDVADVKGAELLGKEQEEWLAGWAKATKATFPVVLSQTLWTGLHTLPEDAHSDDVVPSLPIFARGEYAPNDVPALDLDTNGWPQTPRNRIMRVLAAANVLHVTGDQHLSSVIRYGINRHDDGPFAICSPSVSNVWPRRWMPRAGSGETMPGMPPYTGRFRDAFGHPVTVWAVANPYQSGRPDARMHDRVTGYSIVRFDSYDGSKSLESWPRYLSDKPFPGFPVVVDAEGRAQPAPIP